MVNIYYISPYPFIFYNILPAIIILRNTIFHSHVIVKYTNACFTICKN